MKTIIRNATIVNEGKKIITDILLSNERIEKISIDARTWMAYEPNIVNQSATPNYEDIDVNIVDLHKSATPNY